MAETKKPEIISVEMEDGRIVDFTGSRKILKSFEIDEENQTITVRLDFRNGKTISCQVPAILHLRAAAHGILQKLGDEAGSFKDSLDDAFTAVEVMAERIVEGQWNAERSSDTISGQSLLVQALMEFRSKSAQEVKDFLKDKTKEEKLAIKMNPKILPIIKRLEEERAAKTVKDIDSESMLEDF